MTSFTRSPILQRGQPFEITVDGRSLQAFPGESVAAVLLASGVGAFRVTPKGGAPRSLFCGMGACFDCLVTVDGVPNVRSCATVVRPGLRVETGLGAPVQSSDGHD